MILYDWVWNITSFPRFIVSSMGHALVTKTGLSELKLEPCFLLLKTLSPYPDPNACTVPPLR